MKIFSFTFVMILVLSSLVSCVATPEPVEETIPVIEPVVEPVMVADVPVENPAELPDATSAATNENWESPTDNLEADQADASPSAVMVEPATEEEPDATTAASEAWE